MRSGQTQSIFFFSLSQKSVLQLLKPSIKSTSLTETHVRAKSTYGSIYMIYSVSTSFDSGDGYKNQNKIDSCGHSMCQRISTATMTTIHVYCVFYSKKERKRVTIFLLIINKTDKMCCFFKLLWSVEHQAGCMRWLLNTAVPTHEQILN